MSSSSAVCRHCGKHPGPEHDKYTQCPANVRSPQRSSDSKQRSPAVSSELEQRMNAAKSVVDTITGPAAQQSERRAARRVVVDPREAEKSIERARKLAERAKKTGLQGGYDVWLEKTTNERGVVNTELCWSGTPYQLPGGWTFVAASEKLSDGQAVTRMLPGYQGELLDREWLAEQICDHCHTNRHRKTLVIVENDKGERLRVGRECCKHYLGWRYSPALLEDVNVSMEELGGYGGPPQEYATHDILKITAMISRAFGWVPRSHADERTTPTADLVTLYITETPPLAYAEFAKELKRRGVAPSDQDQHDIDQAKEWLANQPATSEYISNAKAVLEQEYISYRHTGLAISVVPVALQALRKKQDEAASGMSEEIYAPEKTKVDNLELTVVNAATFDTQYGPTTIYTFHGDGHRFQWRTNSVDLNVDETYTMKGTVKGVKEWQDKTYTLLTRCKIID